MGYKNMIKQGESTREIKKLSEENKILLEQIEFILTKGTSEFLANARAKIEKNKQDIECLKDIDRQYQKKIEEAKSINRLNSIGSSSGMFVSKRREHQYQNPIDRVAYRVTDKEKYLKYKGSKNIN
jgi:hypothetical protein|tara:strand:- start:263 stop:640 length:378 start_codon:yes stop_codon:yes gene_type:complete